MTKNIKHLSLYLLAICVKTAMGFKTHYPWHIEYLNLKEFMQRHVHKGLSDLLLKQAMKPFYERCPPYTRRKGATFSLN